MRVKICGITDLTQATEIASLGATALGFICVRKSPRYVSPPQIAAITKALSGVDTIGVFADAEIESIVATVMQTHITGVQLHGTESVSYCQELRSLLPNTELIKAFRVKDSQTLAETAAYSQNVDTLLLDAYHPQMLGGTGHTLNWQSLQFAPDLPWLLAGGLNPDNVITAIKQLHPDGIDLSSGVERSPGTKDLKKVKELFTALKKISA